MLAKLLIYPGTDSTTARPSHQSFCRDDFLSQEERDLFYHNYLAGQPLDTDPRVSPLLIPEPGALPAAVLVTAGFDMLRDEGEAYADHLRRRGTPVKLMRFERLGHGFINLASAHNESKMALCQISAQWRQHCRHHLN
jgi:acetyl esterase